jgi:hypothetical protein
MIYDIITENNSIIIIQSNGEYHMLTHINIDIEVLLKLHIILTVL